MTLADPASNAQIPWTHFILAPKTFLRSNRLQRHLSPWKTCKRSQGQWFRLSRELYKNFTLLISHKKILKFFQNEYPRKSLSSRATYLFLVFVSLTAANILWISISVYFHISSISFDSICPIFCTLILCTYIEKMLEPEFLLTYASLHNSSRKCELSRKCNCMWRRLDIDVTCDFASTSLYYTSRTFIWQSLKMPRTLSSLVANLPTIYILTVSQRHQAVFPGLFKLSTPSHRIGIPSRTWASSAS